MIAIDTNILVYSVREDSPSHQSALACVRGMGGREVGAVGGCHSPGRLLDGESHLHLIGEAPGYWEHLKRVLAAGKAVGPLIHDGRVAAI